MSFAAGLIAGVVATALLGLLVFKAEVIAGRSNVRIPDLRTVIAVVALLLSVVALVHSGHTDSDAKPAGAGDNLPADSTSSTAPAPSSSTSTSSPVLSRITVPKVIGLPQAAAIEQLRAVGLKAEVQTLPLASVPAGFVVTQTPNAFSTTTTNSIVALGVSGAA